MNHIIKSAMSRIEKAAPAAKWLKPSLRQLLKLCLNAKIVNVEEGGYSVLAVYVRKQGLLLTRKEAMVVATGIVERLGITNAKAGKSDDNGDDVYYTGTLMGEDVHIMPHEPDSGIEGVTIFPGKP